MEASHDHHLLPYESVEEPVREAPEQLTTDVAVNYRS
jgi:hypothetical protein